MLEESGMHLGEQRHVGGATAGGCVPEADLIPENRFACAWRALEDIDPTLEKTATQNLIESGDAARQTPELGHLLIALCHRVPLRKNLYLLEARQ